MTKPPVFIGETPAAKTVRRQIEMVAPSDLTVLLRGETGVGKEVAAALIHHLSPRRTAQFVLVDCPAIPSSLAESELFGFERGAFTGANATKKGLLAAANGGTVFFDEIGDMDIELQLRLFRFLNGDNPRERELRSVGGTSGMKVDVRVIAATNQDLEDHLKFRREMLHRLNVFTINIPALRERRDDIPLFVQHFANGATIAPEAMRHLMTYSWPGNIRELRNVMARAHLSASYETRSVITVEDIALPLSVPIEDNNQEDILPPGFTLAMKLKAVERSIIIRALTLNGWHVSATAPTLGLDRTALHKKMRDHGITRP